MSATEIWLSIAAITLATVVTRAGTLFLDPSLQIGPRLTAALRYAPACALAAIIVPDLVLVHGRLETSLANPRLLAGAIAAAIFAATRGTLRTIVGGMLAYWLLRLLLVH